MGFFFCAVFQITILNEGGRYGNHSLSVPCRNAVTVHTSDAITLVSQNIPGLVLARHRLHIEFHLTEIEDGGLFMGAINLRKYYPYYHQDVYVDVSEEVAAQLEQWERDENAYYLRRRRSKAYYSLDFGDGIENQILFAVNSPAECFERKLSQEQLLCALASIPAKQAKRIYAHYILGISKADISRAEGVGRERVGKSIAHGLKNLERVLKNSK